MPICLKLWFKQILRLKHFVSKSDIKRIECVHRVLYSAGYRQYFLAEQFTVLSCPLITQTLRHSLLHFGGKITRQWKSMRCQWVPRSASRLQFLLENKWASVLPLMRVCACAAHKTEVLWQLGAQNTPAAHPFRFSAHPDAARHVSVRYTLSRTAKRGLYGIIYCSTVLLTGRKGI